MVKLRNATTSSHKNKMLRSQCMKKKKLKRSKPTKRVLQSSVKKLPASSKKQLSAALKSCVSKRTTAKDTVDSLSSCVNGTSNNKKHGHKNQNSSQRVSRVSVHPAKNARLCLPTVNHTSVSNNASIVTAVRKTSIKRKKSYVKRNKTLKRKSQNVSLAKPSKESVSKPVSRKSTHKNSPVTVTTNHKFANAKKLCNNNIKPNKATVENNSFSKNEAKCVVSPVNQTFKKKSHVEKKEFKNKYKSLAKNAEQLLLSVADKIMVKTKASDVSSEETFKIEPSSSPAYENCFISDLSHKKNMKDISTQVVNQIRLIPVDKSPSRNKTNSFPSKDENCSAIMSNRKYFPIVKEVCTNKRKSFDSSDNHILIKKRKTSISDNHKPIKRSVFMPKNNPSTSLSVDEFDEEKNSQSFLCSGKKTVSNNNLKLLPNTSKKSRSCVRKLSVSLNKSSTAANTKYFPDEISSAKHIGCSSKSSRFPSQLDDYNKYFETIPVDDLSLSWRSQTSNSKSGKTPKPKCIAIKRRNIRSSGNTPKHKKRIIEKDNSDYEDDLYDPKKFEKFKDLLKYPSDSEFDYDISTLLGITLVSREKGNPESEQCSPVQLQTESLGLNDCSQLLVQKQKETPEVNDRSRPMDDALPKNEEYLPNRKRYKKINNFFKAIKRKNSIGKKEKKFIRQNRNSTRRLQNHQRKTKIQ